jgi:hypothetical protein
MTPDEARTYGREMCWLAGVAERLSLRGVARVNLHNGSQFPTLKVVSNHHTFVGDLDRNGVEDGRQSDPAAQRIVSELREEYAREFGPKGEGA